MSSHAARIALGGAVGTAASPPAPSRVRRPTTTTRGALLPSRVVVAAAAAAGGGGTRARRGLGRASRLPAPRSRPASSPRRSSSSPPRASSSSSGVSWDDSRDHSASLQGANGAGPEKFVEMFRQASPYIVAHQGSVVVIVIPGAVMRGTARGAEDEGDENAASSKYSSSSSRNAALEGIVQDVGLLHSLGVRVVLVLGSTEQIDEMSATRNIPTEIVDGYRITDRDALEVAMEAAGRNNVLVQALFSRGVNVAVARKHGENSANTGGNGGFAPGGFRDYSRYESALDALGAPGGFFAAGGSSPNSYSPGGGGGFNNGFGFNGFNGFGFEPGGSSPGGSSPGGGRRSTPTAVSGNFITAKRRGVVGGVDYLYTGDVVSVDAAAIRARLAMGDVVLLSSLGFNAAGEVLNCQCYDVAVSAAIDLGADKLVGYVDSDDMPREKGGTGGGARGDVMKYMPLGVAEAYIAGAAEPPSDSDSEGGASSSSPTMSPWSDAVHRAVASDLSNDGAFSWLDPAWSFFQETTVAANENENPAAGSDDDRGGDGPSSSARESFMTRGLFSRLASRGGNAANTTAEERFPEERASGPGPGPGPGPGSSSSSSSGSFYASSSGSSTPWRRLTERGLRWRVDGCPQEVCAAVFACKAGVRRAHLLDWTVPGALLLELYTFDGVGSMVSRDRYEGTRVARPGDWAHIKSILEPLAREGVTVAVDDAALIDEVTRGVFHVVERDGKIIACAALRKYRDRDRDADATSGVTAEVGSFAVRVGYRNEGRGDQLLSYLERTALRAGVTRLFLLTTRTADWFVERGFIFAGEAKGHPLLPAGKVVKEGRGSQLYIRALVGEPKEEAKEKKAKVKEEKEEAEAKEAKEAKETAE